MSTATTNLVFSNRHLTDQVKVELTGLDKQKENADFLIESVINGKFVIKDKTKPWN